MISADGAFVVFSSRAGNLVSGLGTSGVNQVYLYERATDTVTLVSHAAGSSAGANKDSTKPSISANGAYVAFQSSATNLVAGQAEGNLATDVFLFERATGTIKLVSRNATSQTTTSNGFANKAVISADGAFVAL